MACEPCHWNIKSLETNTKPTATAGTANVLDDITAQNLAETLDFFMAKRLDEIDHTG